MVWYMFGDSVLYQLYADSKSYADFLTCLETAFAKFPLIDLYLFLILFVFSLVFFVFLVCWFIQISLRFCSCTLIFTPF